MFTGTELRRPVPGALEDKCFHFFLSFFLIFDSCCSTVLLVVDYVPSCTKSFELVEGLAAGSSSASRHCAVEMCEPLPEKEVVWMGACAALKPGCVGAFQVVPSGHSTGTASPLYHQSVTVTLLQVILNELCSRDVSGPVYSIKLGWYGELCSQWFAEVFLSTCSDVHHRITSVLLQFLQVLIVFDIMGCRWWYIQSR